MKYISWRRVSTFKQNRSGLGLEAQKEIIRYFVERNKGELIADYSECYTGKELSGCVELRKAMAHAKKENAILVIAKSDRFRNCQEALGILTEMGEGHLEFCDLPHSDRFTLTLFWALAEREALITSIRTKQALAALKARGDVKLGSANEKYRASYDRKTKDEKRALAKKRGDAIRKSYMESRDVQAFLKVLTKVFPDDCKVSLSTCDWRWRMVNTKGDNKTKMLQLMRDYQDLDGSLFKDWDFSDKPVKLQMKLASLINTIKSKF